MCNPGVVSEMLTCFYACAAVNWFENKVNQFTAARTPYEPGLHKAVHVARDYIQALCFARGLLLTNKFVVY
jgi:hypothetical protein